MVLNEKEQNALDIKIENPKLIVKCPRCGAVIEYHEFPTAVRVNCPTKGCIEKSLRGI